MSKIRLVEIQLNSAIKYSTSNGLVNNFPITFDYEKEDYLQVFIGFKEVAEFNVITHNGLPCVQFHKDVPTDTYVVIRRVTPSGVVPHTYQYLGNAQGGAEFNAKTIDENFQYLSNIVSEVEDFNKISQDGLKEIEEKFKDTQELAEEAINTAIKADNKADQAVRNAEKALQNSKDALEISLQASDNSTEAIKIAEQARETANKSKDFAEEAVQISNDAKEIASKSDAKADDAVRIANNAETKAKHAVDIADSALEVALGIDAKAQEALDKSKEADAKSDTALSTSNDAKEIAEGIEGVANDAKSIAEEAKKIAEDALGATTGDFVVQETGQSEVKVMSQKAVTDCLDLKADLTYVDEAVSNIDLSDYATNDYVNNKTKDLASENFVKDIINSLNIDNYRTLDNNVFNGLMSIKSDNDDQGVGIFLQESDGTPRASMVSNSHGLQFMQRQEDDTAQSFTFPRYGKGGEIVLVQNLYGVLGSTLGLAEGKESSANNTKIIRDIQDSNLTIILHSGDWWFEDNLSIPTTIRFVGDGILNFKTFILRRRGGSSGSKSVDERYTLPCLIHDIKGVTAYINEDVVPIINYDDSSTVTIQGSVLSDKVEIHVQDGYMPTNLYNNAGNITHSPNLKEPMFVNNQLWGDNTSHGVSANLNLNSGHNNTALGSKALLSNIESHNNTAVGFQALYRTKRGGNTAVGSIALEWLEDGRQHTAIGAEAGGKWRGGENSVAIGNKASFDNTNPKFEVAIGYRAHGAAWGSSNEGCVYVGAYSGDFVNGNHNTGVGYRALNAIGQADLLEPAKHEANTALGSSAGRYHSSGSFNVMVGYSASRVRRDMTHSVIIGNEAGYANTKLSYSTLVGSKSGRDASGNYTTLLGYRAGENIKGDGNTIVGALSSPNLKGDNNTMIGIGAGSGISEGDHNTFIGNEAGKLLLNGEADYTVNYSTCVGYGSRVSGSSQLQLGNPNTSTYVYGSVQSRSDIRDKTDIAELSLGLDLVKKLQPKEYRWAYRELEGQEGVRRHTGFIAQDILKVIDPDVYALVQDHKVNGGSDVLTIGYEQFIPILTKAIQEQQESIERLQKELGDIKRRLNE